MEATAATNVFKCLVLQRGDVHLAFTSATRAEMKKHSFWLHKVITNEAREHKKQAGSFYQQRKLKEVVLHVYGGRIRRACMCIHHCVF